MNSLTLKLSIFFVVLASICFSAPIIDQTTMESELFDTTELVPRALEESNSTISISATTEKDEEEEMSTVSTKTSTKSSHDKESEADESHETREVREFSELNTSESPMYVTEKSTLYAGKDSHYNRMLTTIEPLLETETEQIPHESSTTMKMISTSFSSSKVPEKYLGRLEDQNEPSEDIETTTKVVRKVTKTTIKYQEEEQPEQQQQPMKKVQKPTQQPAEELEQEVPVTEESEVKGDYKVAEYDPKALDSIGTMETSRLQYDENNQTILNIPVELTTMQLAEEKDHPKLNKPVQKEKTLDQAQESPVAEEEKSNH